jgi:hypothetical protein
MKLKDYKKEDLTLHNYKEPLTKIEGGHGYYGTITATVDGKYIQCHICGDLFENLGNHLRHDHKTNGKEYKERFGLAFMSALVSETYRLKQKKRSVKWWHNLSDEEKSRRKEMARRNRRKNNKQPRQQLETKNKRGTCPDQLLEKIREVADKLGRTPSKRDFIKACGTQRYVHLIYKTFGSWSGAVDMAGYRPLNNKVGKGGYRKYEDEELLAYLANFAEEHKEIPSYSDFFRGDLPSLGVYERRWGNLENARVVAGVYDILKGIKPL